MVDSSRVFGEYLRDRGRFGGQPVVRPRQQARYCHSGGHHLLGLWNWHMNLLVFSNTNFLYFFRRKENCRSQVSSETLALELDVASIRQTRFASTRFQFPSILFLLQLCLAVLRTFWCWSGRSSRFHSRRIEKKIVPSSKLNEFM